MPKWTTLFRTVLSSIADVAGDYIFLEYSIKPNDSLNNFELPVMVFLGFSFFFSLGNIFFALRNFGGWINNTTTTTTQGTQQQRRKSKKRVAAFCTCRGIWTRAWDNMWPLGEIWLEDIPQIIMSIWATVKIAGWAPATVLNLVTSVYNLLFNLIGLWEDPLPQCAQCQHILTCPDTECPKHSSL